MKYFKNIKLLILMMCLQSMCVQAGDESHQNYAQDRQQTINNVVVSFPHLVQELDVIHQQHPVVLTWYDFLEKNLAHDDEEVNFGELHLQAIEFTHEHMKIVFIKTLEYAIEEKKYLDQYQDPVFTYVMQHKNDYMQDTVRQWLHEWYAQKSNHPWNKREKAECWNNIDIARLLITAGIDFNTPDDFGDTLFHQANRNQNIEIIQLLIRAGVNINVQDKDGHTALHIAAVFVMQPWHRVITHNKMGNIAQILINAGANINFQDKSGNTPLHCTAWSNNKEITQLLILANADVNIKNNFGWTPLSKATHHKNKKIIELLINARADINVQDKCGQTALHNAVYNNDTDLAQLLIHAGADLNLEAQATGVVLGLNKGTAEQRAYSNEMQAVFNQHRQSQKKQSKDDEYCTIS